MKLFQRLLLVVLTISIQSTLFSQNWNNYQSIESAGEVPSDFIIQSSKTISEQQDEFTESDYKKEKQLKEKFLIQSTFSTDELIQSGIVLYGDPATKYVNKVAAEILRSDKELKEELRFYVAKSPFSNAYTFNNGIIIINLGLLAQLETEGQLALIIAHEISHYVNQDAVDKFLEADQIASGRGIYKQLSNEEKTSAGFEYSKDIESRCDDEGLDLFLKSKYSTEDLENSFDVLKYSYLPFDEIEFDKTFLETKHCTIPTKFMLTELNPIEAEEDKEENEDKEVHSTHPSCDERKSLLLSRIDDKDNTGKKLAVVSGEEFKKIQKIARFEQSRMYLLNGLYEESLYNTYLLLQDDPENRYLQKMVARNLLMIGLHINEKESLKSRKFRSDIQGESHQVYHLISKYKRNKPAYNVLAVSKIYEIYQDYPEDKELEEVFTTMVHSMVKTQEMTYGFIKGKIAEVEKRNKAIADKAAREANPDKEDNVEADKGKSKLDKIKEKEKEEIEEDDEITQEEDYIFGFIDYLEDEKFKQTFKAVEKEIDKDESDKKRYDEMSKRERRKWDKLKEPLDIKKVVVVDPFYAKINARKKESYKFFDSEAGHTDYIERIEKISNTNALDIDFEIIDPALLQNTTEDLLLVHSANEWFSEQAQLDGDIEFSNIEDEKINAFVKEFGTEYVMWTGNVSLKDRSSSNVLMPVLYSIYFPPLLIFTAPPAFSTTNYTINFNILYNIKTQEILYSSYEELNYKTKSSLLNSIIYRTLNEIDNL